MHMHLCTYTPIPTHLCTSIYAPTHVHTYLTYSPNSSPLPDPHKIPSGGRRRHNKNLSFDRQLGKMGKGAVCVEYTDYGTGDFRSPSFMVVDNCNGSNISPLRYRRHAIYRGKLPMPDSMPGIRCASEREASNKTHPLYTTHTY
mmetsp:Transcript_3006/g.6983  ORF Transcript_3006/g.6983 Transcript_3006/m.6983 type:complete len:144 (+) Transcript_3006:129-560(+)